jgi:hypothetical protein
MSVGSFGRLTFLVLSWLILICLTGLPRLACYYYVPLGSVAPLVARIG